jgi:hypothetical protein
VSIQYIITEQGGSTCNVGGSEESLQENYDCLGRTLVVTGTAPVRFNSRVPIRAEVETAAMPEWLWALRWVLSLSSHCSLSSAGPDADLLPPPT